MNFPFAVRRGVSAG